MTFSLEQYGWKQFATWEPLAVFSSERKAPCLKKTKRLKERPLGVKKKNPGVQFVVSDKDQVGL